VESPTIHPNDSPAHGHKCLAKRQLPSSGNDEPHSITVR
jgi:hypothetical protein